MADTDPQPTQTDQVEKPRSMEEQEEEERETHPYNTGGEEDSDSDSESEQASASEDGEDTSSPAPEAPREEADTSTPAPAPATEAPSLNVPDGGDAPRSSEQIFDHRLPLENRPRTDSQSTVATTATRPSTRSSLVFVVTALETIAASKDARKNKKLGDSTNAALSAIKNEGDPARINPEVLFEPLQLASEAPNVPVSITALDCIGKLISYSYFSVPAEPRADNSEEVPPLIERAIDTICDCFQGEATAPEVQLQIVKSLLAAILNDKIVVHGAGLLKAVRLTYNIFLLSKSSANQQVAQGALTQMVGTVFERVKTRLAIKEARLNLSRSSLNEKGQSEESVQQDEGSMRSRWT